MSELKERLRTFSRTAQRYLQVAHLTPSLPLLLLLGPMVGALLLAFTGAPPALAATGLVLTTLSLWGTAWSLHELMNARRRLVDNSLILRGVLTQRQALGLFVALLFVALSTALLMGGRFALFAVIALLVVLTFPWLRQRTYLIEAWFGLGLACIVPLAYAAAGRWPDKVGALLGVVTLLWAMGWLVLLQWPRHIQLMERGMRSLGLMFGDSTGHLVLALQSAVLLGAWMAGLQAGLGHFYSIALLIALALLAWQWRLLHRHTIAAHGLLLRLHLFSGAVIWLGVPLHFLGAAAA